MANNFEQFKELSEGLISGYPVNNKDWFDSLKIIGGDDQSHFEISSWIENDKENFGPKLISSKDFENPEDSNLNFSNIYLGQSTII